MADYHTADEDFYRKLDVPIPATSQHGTEDDIASKLVPMMPNKWKLAGNQLIAETENGTHVQTIPTDYILTGTDEKGMPIFKRIDI